MRYVFTCREEDGKQVLGLPKVFKMTLYIGDASSGNIGATAQDLHALADWIKVNVPLSLADTRNRDEDLRQAILDHCESVTIKGHPRYNMAIRGIASDIVGTEAVNVVDDCIDTTVQQLKREGVIFWHRHRKRWVIKT